MTSLTLFFLQQKFSDNEILFWNKKVFFDKAVKGKRISLYQLFIVVFLSFSEKKKKKENGKMKRKNKIK